MRTARWLAVGAGSLLGVLLVTGCGPDPRDAQIAAQAERIAELTRENDDLRSRLAQALQERDAARLRAQQLEQQVRDLQGQLAAKPPVETPGDWQRAGVYTWTTLSTDFLFDSGSATLRAQARAKLSEVASIIRTKFPEGEYDIWVLGHTDTDPINRTKDKWADNLDLSCNRGMTVYRALMDLGIRPVRMIAGGQGEWFPVADNSSKAGKQQNRRVEIIAVPSRPAKGQPTAPGRSPAGGGEPMGE